MRQSADCGGHVPCAESGSEYMTYGFSCRVTTRRWYLAGRPFGGDGSPPGHVMSPICRPSSEFQSPIWQSTQPVWSRHTTTNRIGCTHWPGGPRGNVTYLILGLLYTKLCSPIKPVEQWNQDKPYWLNYMQLSINNNIVNVKLYHIAAVSCDNIQIHFFSDQKTTRPRKI